MKSTYFSGASVSLILCLVGTFLFSACADGNACDANMEREGNYCVEKSDDGSGGSASGGGGAGGAEPDPSGPVEPNEDFGVVCTDDDGCGAGAPLCGKAPGASEGICTVSGCESDPENVVCPLGWSCFSLADACLED